MKVYEILETFELQPAQTLTSTGSKTQAFNVIDTKTGQPVKTFQGPDAAGKAEEYRDQQNKLRNANKPKKDTDTDSDTNKKTTKTTKVKNKQGVLKIVGKGLGKAFMIGGKLVGGGSLVGTIFSVVEMRPIAEDWALAYAANGCKFNVHEDPSIGLTRAKSKEHVNQMLYRQKEATAVVSGGIAAALTAMATKGARMARAALVLANAIPPAPGPSLIAKVLGYVASGVTWIALPYLVGKLAKNSRMHDGLGQYIVGSAFGMTNEGTATAKNMNSLSYMIATQYCSTDEEFNNWKAEQEIISEDNMSKAINQINKGFAELISDPKTKQLLKKVQKAPAPKSLAT
tara:strand:+ start:65 stop:1093 length:1029 start_codon:yes stop_codon:yes gene_type:complete